MADFSERLKKLRIEKRLTQEQLAEKFFLNKSSVSRYERGQQIPEVDLLQSIAEYFNVSMDYLLGRVDERNLHEMKKDEIPDLLKDLGVEYMTVAKRIKDEGLTPQEIETMIEAIKKIKNDNR